MNRLRETAWFDKGSRNKIWALLGAYALVALTVVTSTSDRQALAAATPVQLANSWTTGLTHTVGAGSDRLLVYVVTIESAGGDVTNVTYGGRAMTEAVEDVYTSGDGNRVEIWHLDEAGIQAASGNSFVPTYSVGPDVELHAAVTFANVDQSAPIVSTASTTGTNATLTTAPFSVVADGMAVSGTSHEGGGSYADGGWGSGWGEGVDQASGTTQGTGYTTSAYGASGTDTATATHSSSGRHAIAAISLAPASGDSASVSGLVWQDSNQDAIPQAGENVYLSGVTMNLYAPGPDTILGTPDDVLADTTTSDGVGTYSFTSLSAGWYHVEADETTLPPNYRLTSFANPATIQLAAAEALTGQDFGYYRNSGSGSAWHDANPEGGVLPGQVITYERYYENTSYGPRTNVWWENPLPAGTTYVPGSTTVEVLPSPSFRDRFEAAHYNNNQGTWVFDGPWQEIGETTDPAAGDWQWAVDPSFNEGLRKGGAPGTAIARPVSSFPFTEAFLDYTYRRENVPAGVTIEAQVSSTGVGGPWTTVGLIQGAGAGVTDPTIVSVDAMDISAHLGGDLAIRFEHTAGVLPGGSYIYLDFPTVFAEGAPSISTTGNAPPNLNNPVTVAGGEKLRVTFQVTVDDPTAETEITSTGTVHRDGSGPWVMAADVNPVKAVSGDAGAIVINEVLYEETPGIAANDEFVELYNASGSPVVLDGWTLANGWYGLGADGYVFPAGTTLNPAEYAVIWVGPAGATQTAPGAAYEDWIDLNERLDSPGDAIWLWDANDDVVDVMVWGSGSGSPPHATLWDGTYQASLAGAAAGQSVSLTPNGIDGHDSACWERTISGDASGRCAGYVATRDANAGAATWSVGASNNTPPGVYGTIFEDMAGDVLDGAQVVGDIDNPGVPGVTVTLWNDNPGVGLAGAGDVIYVQGGLTNPTTTDAGGEYAFPDLPAGDYFVVVDSKTITPTAGLESGHTADETWAEQTWAPAYGYRRLSPASKAWSNTAKPFYGGANDQGQWYAESDDATDVETAEHLSGVTLLAGEVRTAVDFGFSFNVVTNVLGGDTTDHDGSAARTVQGSFRQFLQNANAIAGGNAMRFVPVLPANDTSWWEVKVTNPLPSVIGANTTIDGTAFEFVDGVAVRDENAGATGYNAAGDKTVGTDGIALPVIGRPEFEIEADRTIANPVEVGIHGDANGLAVRDLAIFGFGDTGVGNTDANILLGPSGGSDYTGLVIERNLIGSEAGDFVGPIIAGTGAGVYLETANGAIVRDNLIGFTTGRTINALTVTGTVIQGNELTTVSDDVMDVYLASDLTTIEENHISGGIHWGIDFIGPSGTIRNNTIVNAGDGAGQTGGLRLFSTGHTVDRNVFTSNDGPGVLIAGDKGTAEIRPAGEAVITGNEFSGNTGLAIDLQVASDDNNLSGDGITANNGGATDVTHGNHELDFPEISGASVSGGTTTVTGTACSGCTVEIFQAVGGTGDDDPPGSASNYHGEGIAYLGTGVATGGAFSIDVTGLIAGDEVSATATDTGLAVTSEFSLNEAVVPAPVSISGTIFEDQLGDGLADGPLGVGANPFESGVRIEAFRDGGDNTPDGGDDVYQGFTVSALADGTYSFAGLTAGVYWVTVDSQGVFGGPLNAGFAASDTWAEQTYGPAGAASFDGSTWSFAGSAGAHYGGARGDVSDNFPPTASLPGAEHIARVDTTGGAQAGVDFGFSFNVVSSVEPATAVGVSGRSAQGSFDQFIRNANAIAGVNAMRFVPSVAQNDGSGSWWRIDYAAAANPLQDIFDSGTVIDGTAFDAADGVTAVNSNSGFLGANAAGGVSVGTAPTPLPQVAKPELEIKDEGLRLSQAQAPLLPNNTEIRDLSVWGSATSIYALTGVSSLTGLIFDGNVIGTPPDAFVDPATVGANYGLRVYRATGTQVTNNLIGFVDFTPLLLETATSGATVTGNEIRGGGRTQAAWDGVLLWGAGDTIDGNLIADNGAMGIDLNATVGGHTIESNTVQNSGLLGAQTAGLRIKNHDNTVRFNVFENNAGPGVSIEGGAGAALRNLVSGNEFITNGGLSIDLALLALADDLGDGVNPNDAATNVAHGNEGLDYPVITSAQHDGAAATIAGSTCAACRVEVYRAVGGAGDAGPGGDHGEGVEYLGFTTADGAGAFSLVTALVGPADQVSAIAIDGTDNTSEFGENHPVNGAPVFDTDLPNRSDAEGTVISLASAATDPDLDTLAYSATGLPPGLGINPTSGLISGTIGFGAAAGSPYAVSITVIDGNGGSDNDTFTWTVTNTNQAPTADPIADTSVDELTLLSFTATGSDPDLDGLTWTMPSGPVGASITAGGVFSWTPTEAQGPGSYPVTVRVTDDGAPNLWDEEAFTVTVGEVNLAPVLDPVGNQSVDELVNLSFAATASDPDTPPNNLVFSLSGAPVGASITAGGVFSWTPTEAQGPGPFTFDVVVTETDGSPTNLSDSETITVTVGEVNVAPVADAIANQSVDELSLLSLTATASDVDVPANNLAYSMVSGPGFILPNGNYSWTPTEAQGPGTYTVTLRVTDDGAGSLSDTVSFDVTVNEVDLAPVLDPVGNQSVDELLNLSFTATASDPDTPPNSLVFSLSGAPVGASITAGGVFSWTPTEAQGPGPFTFDVVVTETDGSPSNLSDSETITVTVTEVDLAPVLDPVGDRSVDELANLSFTATASDPDDPANNLTFSLSGAPVGASITPAGDFSWTPSEAQGPGSYMFDVVVTETDGSPVNLSESETITATVNEVNQAPVLTDPGAQASTEGDSVTLPTVVTDGDLPTNAVAFSATGLPPGLSIASDSGVITGVVSYTAAAGSPYGVTVSVVDSGSPGLGDSVNFSWTVAEGGESLTVAKSSDGGGSVLPGDTISYAITVTNDDTVTHTGIDVSDAVPAGTTYVPGSSQVTVPATDSYRDDFLAVSYSGSTGSLSWSATPWQEGAGLPESDGPSTGPVRISSFSDVLQIFDEGYGASRALDLTSFTSAQLEYRVGTNGLNGNTLEVEMWDGATWVTVDSMPTGFVGTRTIDVSAFAGMATSIRYIVPPAPVIFQVNINHVEIRGATGAGTDTFPGGDPPNLATGYSLAPGETMTVEFQVTVDDPPSVGQVENLAEVTSDLQTIALQATATDDVQNRAPVLGPIGAQSGDELSAITFTATASDPDLDGLAFSLSGQPPGASITAGGAFSWTPTEAQGPGSYTFDVVVTDDGVPNLADSETLTVTVNEVDLAPVLDPVGNQSVDELVNLSFTATASDPDTPANNLVFSLSGAPVGASITAAGVFSWTPTEAQGPGPFTFDVVVTETDGSPTNLSDSETITVTVGEANVAPVADAIANQSVDELSLLSLTATASDVDVPANNLAYSMVSGPGFILPNGNYSWTPTEAQGPGTYTVTLRVTDDGAGSLSDTVSFDVTVNEVDLAPVLDPVGNQSVDELVNLSFTATASDPDTPANNLVFSLSGAPVGASITAGGVFSWTPTEAQGPGPFTFDVVVTETDGSPTNLSDSETITVTVGEANVAPVADAIADISVDELTVLTLTATASDVDVPANTLAWSMVSGPGFILPNGNYSWTPTEAQGPGTYTVTLRVTDDGAGSLSDTVSFDVTVNEVDLAPVLDPVGNQSVDELVNLSFTATASDPDTPANNLVFSLSGAPVGASITAGGVFSWTPTEAQGPGPFTFDVVVTETDGSPVNLTDSETLTVTVNEVDLAPVLDPVGNQSVDELVNLSFTATASDPDTPANNLVFSLSGAPVGASITAAGVFSWTPTEAQGPGPFTFDVVVTETDGSPTNLSDSETITVTVGEANVAPVADAIANQSVDELSLLSLTATASDVDVPANNLAYSMVSGPGFILPNGNYSWTPTEAQGPGTYTVTLRVTDDGAGSLSDTVSFDVTVNEVDLAPVLDPVGNQSVDELVNLSFTATASDPDDPANNLVFSLSGAPVGASITAGGVFSWTPTEAQGPGSFVFDVVVTETDGSPVNLSDSETITVTVGEVNLAPVLAFVGNKAVDELTLLSFTATASDPDTPANNLVFSLSGAPVGASITAGGAFSWTPTEAQGPGSFVFDVVVTETDGSPVNLSDSETITVTVGEGNLPPTLDPVGDQSVDELVNLSFTATASDPDTPANNLVFSLSGAPVGASITAGGAFSWTPTEAQGPGSFVFDVVVTETDGSPVNLSDSETITVTVGEVNLAPVLDPVGDQSIDELVNLSFTATASDPDTPANNLVFSLSGAPVGASITAGGAFSWTPTEAQGPGSFVFDVVVTETDGSPVNLSDSETITVTVGEGNLPPTLDPVGDQSVDELVNLSFTATASDPDTPANNLVFSLSGAPVGASITAGGAFSWTPTEAQGPGSFVFDVVVTETDGSPVNLSDSETITVTVGEVNLAPVLDPVGDQSIDELTLLSFTATAFDPDTPPNNLTFSLLGAPAGASITPAGVFNWTPTEAQGPGVYSFDVVVTETNGSPTNRSDSETITITVGEVNLPPVPVPISDFTFSEYTVLNLVATAADPDTPANGMTWSIVTAPAGATIASGGSFSWTALEVDGGSTYPVTLRVTDDGSPVASSDVSFSIAVTEDNQTPWALPIADVTIDEMVPYSFTAAATDADIPANGLVWSLQSGPGFMLPNGDYFWTPGEADGPGTHAVTVRVTDDGAGNLWDEETFTITVDEVNVTPVADPMSDITVDELTPVSLVATATDVDTPVNGLSWGLDAGPGVITPGGSYSWVPSEADGPGTYTVTLRVTDDGVPPLSDTVSFDVTVGEVNAAPVANVIADMTFDELTLASLTAGASDADVPANSLAWSVDSGPGGITPGGDYSWTPSEADGPGTFTVTLRVTDDGSPPMSDTTSFTITVNEVNIAPVVPPSTYTVDEGGTLAPGAGTGALAGATDAEGDPISAILDGSPAFGTLALFGDGSFTYVHDGSENFVDGFTFTATDGFDSTAPVAVTIAVNPVNDVPVISGVVLSPDENTVVGTVLGGPIASDDDGDPLLFAITTPDPTFTIDALTGDITLAAALDYETVPSYTVTVSATDPSGATAAADVIINVGDIDEAPTGNSAAFPVVEDLAVGSTIGVVSGWDPEGETVSFSLVAGDPAGQFTIDPATGELILVSGLDASVAPSYLLDVSVSDPGGNTAPVAVIVIVTPAAQLPSLNAAPLGVSDLITLDEDTSAIVAPLSNDSDPDADALFVTWIDEPVNGTLIPNGDGSYTYQPRANFNGTETLSYGISDGRGGVDSSTVVLGIRAVNDLPHTPDVEAALEFASSLEIPVPGGIFDPDGDTLEIAVGTPGRGTVGLTAGGFLYEPPPEWNGTDTFTYRATDGNGGSSLGLVTVTVLQLDGDLVAIDLVSIEPSDPPAPAPSSGIIVESIKLLVGTVSEMAGLLGIPILAVGVAFLASLLFGFGRNFLIGRGPVFLPAASPGPVAVVRVPSGGVLTALEGPGEEYPLVYRFQPAETGLRATGRRAQRGSTVWVEVETPDGDAWVIARFVTSVVSAGAFASDDSVTALVDAVVDTIGVRGDLSSLVSSLGLEVAYYAPPRHFVGEELESLLAEDASWGWWDPTGSIPSVRGEFTTMVADPLSEAIAITQPRAVAEAVVDIPVELINFPSLTFSDPGQLGWRVFFEYEDDQPKVAAIWREGVTNPASI